MVTKYYLNCFQIIQGSFFQINHLTQAKFSRSNTALADCLLFVLVLEDIIIDDTQNEVLILDEFLEASQSAKSTSMEFKHIKLNRRKSIQLNRGLKTTRCGNETCKWCIREDCGECSHCWEMPKFGGTRRIKQACIHRQCPYKNMKHGKNKNQPSIKSYLDE